MSNDYENKIAIIGSGPTALYILKHFLDNTTDLKDRFKSITIIDKNDQMGMGFPFNPKTTDRYNLANICCEEIPDLPSSLTQWLLEQDEETLKKWNIHKDGLNRDLLHCRIALGSYFAAQFEVICNLLKGLNIEVNILKNTEATDIIPMNNGKNIVINLKDKKSISCTTTIIATGHKWIEEDKPNLKYYASPWPINKLLSGEGSFYNFPIGLLGASLSAFDVTTTLAHRHGKFENVNNRLVFTRFDQANNFKIILHASQGWLPHLQYEQKEPRREVYRHTTREEILKLRNKNGFLLLKDFYHEIAKPTLIKAFIKDEKIELANKLDNQNFTFKDLVKILSEEHTYTNSFEGLKKEIAIAEKKVTNNKPTYWMETLDDLMYTLNFHADLLCAEDHIFLRDEVFSFLMNVIAALPINSARILVALYEANAIELIEGKVTIKDHDEDLKQTIIEIKSEEGTNKIEKYNMFINCSGQKIISLDEYPFPTLKQNNIIANATAEFLNYEKAEKNINNKWKVEINTFDNCAEVNLGGIQVDPFFRVVNNKKEVHPNIYDVSMAHTSGVRPYSYGLQACDAIAAIVIESLKLPIHLRHNKKIDIETASEIYESEI